MRPLVWAIVLNHNNVEDTVECVESLRRQTYRPKILVVDNGSDEEVFSRIKQKLPYAEHLRLSRNLGYAGGNNRGIEKVIDEADYILVVNNDVVAEEDAVERMVEVMEEDDSIAACQPVVKYESGRIWSAGTEMFFGYPRLYLKDKPVENKDVEINHSYSFEPPFGLAGCAILFRASALKDVGLFDESLFMMHEETEWCLRALKKGYRFKVCSAVVYHKVARTIGLFSPDYLYYVSRNWLLVARVAGRKNYLYALLTEPIRIAYYILKLKRKRDIVHYLRGVRDGILGVRGKRGESEGVKG